MVHLLDVDLSQLEQWCSGQGLPRYRSEQILQWVYGHGAESFEAMTNLSKELRAELTARFRIYESKVVQDSSSADGTRKLLLLWPDRETTECVLIPEGRRQTACLSSQVGCGIGCAFCASGVGGLQRSLTSGQIVEQAVRLAGLARSSGAALTNVVFMGIGEPLANYDAVVRAVRTINASWGMGIGARRITISTVGLPGQIRRLGQEGLQVNLAISLHAPTDAIRRRLIGAAEQVQIAEIIEAASYYFEATGREVTLEYVLLAEVNDRATHAERLARIAGQIRCNVNLISYNPVNALPYRPASREVAEAFVSILRKGGVNVQQRASRGEDIDAACGQLRLRHVAQ